MPWKYLGLLAVASVPLVGSQAHAAEAPWIGGEATRSRLTIISVDGSTKREILDSPRRFAAPDWSPDGKALVINGGGRLWRIPAAGGAPEPIATGPVPWIDINHGLSPDGKTLAFSAAASIFRVPASGGAPERVLRAVPSYFHAWSPDGTLLAYAANRGSGYDIYAISPEGGSERRLTTNPGPDADPQYSPDGRWIYFLSNRAGTRDIWRMPAAGAGPDDAEAEPITSDARDDASPHPSPDGKWLIFVSYPPRTGGNALDRDVVIRRLPLPGDRVVPAEPVEVARLVGGHGTVGSRPFAPDGRTFAYASFEPPPPTIRIVLYTPSDLKPPPGVPHRLTQIAEATERFLFDEMKRSNYPPAVDRLFRRSDDGMVEVVYVKGDRPASDAYYSNAACDAEAREKAKRQLKIDGEGHLWWIFLYVGDRPTRFSAWQGGGSPRDGGTAIVNYDTIPGEIRPDLDLSAGFNDEYFLKGTIHELGHAFGLPHIGPDPDLGRGNSLMGANNGVYRERGYPNGDQVYLTEASAAMLWKHPLFSGNAASRQRQPALQVVGYEPSYNKASNRITLAGKLVADLPAHSVVVLDDLGKADDEYWCRSYVARLEADGSFRVAIDEPARSSGQFRIFFCFDNGMVTGDGAGVVFGDRGAIRKSYVFRDGRYLFGK